MNRPSLKDLACTIAGFALSWYFFPPGFIASFFTGSNDAFLCQVWNGGLLVVLAVVALGAALFPAVAAKLSHRRPVLLALIEGCTAAGYALLHISPSLPGSFSTAALVCSIPLLTLGYTALVLAWAQVVTALEPLWAVISVAASVLLYALLSLLGLGSASTGIALNVLVPCASGLLWFAVHPLPRELTASNGSLSPLRDLPWVQMGLMALFLVGGRIVVGLFFNYSIGLFGIELLVRDTVIALVMAFVLFRLLHASNPYQRAYSAWTLMAIVFLFGTLLELALGSEASVLGCGIINAMLCCFECLSYIMLIQFVQTKSISPTVVFALWLAVFKAIPLFIQRFVVTQLASAFNFPGDMIAIPIMFVIMIVVSGALAIASRQNRVVIPIGAQDVGADDPASQPSPLDELCATAGLTPRERDIVGLIAQGNSQKKIAELLGLSYNTVQSYAKEIYLKMGVHSKQELVDLVAGVPQRDGS